jgi:LacI family transcriptional regulator
MLFSLYSVEYSAVNFSPYMSQPRKKRVTLRDVAHLANVSQKTVSNVINNWPFVSEDTRARVQQALSDTGYRPSQVARSLVTGRTCTVGIIVPDISNPFFSTAFRGCEDRLAEDGYSAFLCNTDEDLTKEQYYLESLVNRSVDGLILWGSCANATVLHRAIGDEVPTISIDGSADDGPRRLISIRLDNLKAAKSVVRHLLSHGRSRVAHILGALHRSTAQERLRGYRLALEEAGVAYDDSLLIEDSPSIAGGYTAIFKLRQQLHDRPMPDGLFCYNDLMAIGAMAALEELNMKVPDEIAVVGFDDIAPAALVTPMLTTVSIPQYELGRFAAEELIQHLNNVDRPPRVVAYPLELKVRNSCGAHRMSNEDKRLLLRQLATSAGAGLPAKLFSVP